MQLRADMYKTTENSNGVTGIISEARNLNPEIGIYKEHFINAKFQYTVRLSNGRIEMSKDIAKHYETQPKSVSEDKIQGVAYTYCTI